jgi:MFS family permease
MRSPGAVLAAATVAQAAVSLVTFGLPAIGPELRSDYGMSLFELGAVLGAGVLGSGVALVGAGMLVDRVGSRPAILAGTALGSLGLVAAAFVPTTWSLFAAIAVSGVGSSVVPIAGVGALFAVYGPTGRGWALGVRQMAVPLGGVIAAILYPTLHAVGGSELTLLLSALAVAATGVWFALAAPQGTRTSTERIARPFRAIFAGLGMRRLMAVAACYVVVLSALLAYAVPSARAAGHSELTASAAFFAVNIAAMLARIVWGKVADGQQGTRRVRTLIEVGAVAMVGAVVFALALHGPSPLVVAAAFAFAFGALGWNALVYVSAGERVDPTLAARSVSVAATVVFVLGGVSTPLLGALADAAGWTTLWVVTAVTAGVGALLAAGLPVPRPTRGEAVRSG